MRLFLSYAGEHRATADAIALRLREAGHDVFFDKDDLPPGEGYDDRIRQALKDSDGFVFLVSPESVKQGRYTLTELAFARERWKNPSGRVLPVMVATTPYADIPEYLKAVTVLEPKGNVVAETAAGVERLTQRPPFRRLAAAALALALVGAGGFAAWRAWGPRPAPSQHARGSVSDLTTEAAVAGAAVEIHCRVETVAEGVTDAAGGFDLAFAPCREAATVSVKHEQYTEQSRPVPADRAEMTVALLPKGLGGCVVKNAQGVVVGHFRPPVSGSDSGGELAGRIADALTYDVLTILQTLNLPSALQPRFLACDEARPRSVDFAAGYARALGADAFLVGSVEPADGAFNVRAFVGDAFQLFKPPLPSITAGVALNDPAVARLAPEMHGAILTAIARGYAERQMFRECVDVAVAAERLLGGRTPALDQTLARCQGGTGLADLRKGG
jgi:hypothetical protein